MSETITDFNPAINPGTGGPAGAGGGRVIDSLDARIVRGIDENGVLRTIKVTPTGELASKDGTLTPLGYVQMTSIASAVALTSIPTGARFALLQAETANIRWRDDGTDPTSTAGVLLLSADSGFWYTGNLATMKVIQAAAGAILNIAYFK